MPALRRARVRELIYAPQLDGGAGHWEGKIGYDMRFPDGAPQPHAQVEGVRISG